MRVLLGRLRKSTNSDANCAQPSQRNGPIQDEESHMTIKAGCICSRVCSIEVFRVIGPPWSTGPRSPRPEAVASGFRAEVAFHTWKHSH